MNKLRLNTFQLSLLAGEFNVAVLQIFLIPPRITQQRSSFEGTLNAKLQDIQFAWLNQIVVSTHSDGVDYSLSAIDAGGYDYCRISIELINLAKEFDTSDSRHLNVGYDQRILFQLQPVKSFLRVCR